MLFLSLCSLLLLGVALCVEDRHKPEVSSPAGIFRGTILTAVSGAEFASYRGIPFALPPTGQRRFALPEPFPKIEDPFYDASDFGSVCVQNIDGVSLGKEDCLFLNVFTPIRSEESENVPLKKVLVFIHGGGLIIGASNLYVPGDLVAKGNVVVVTVNYRLGWLGFLRGNSDSLPGNQAFWDQVLALRWVNKNILAFGGDPDDVTISGESAGALSVSVLSISPVTKGLFSKAILLSGTAFSFPTPPRTSTDLLETAATALGCGNEPDVVFCLKQQPAEKFIFEFSSAILVRLISSGDVLLPKPIPELVNNPKYLHEVGFFSRDYIVSITKDDGYVRVNSRFGEIDTTSLESSILDISRLLHLPEYVVESLLLEYLKSYEEVERAVIAMNTDVFYLQRSNHFLEAYGKRLSQGTKPQKNNIYFMSFDPVPKYFPHQYAPHAIDLVYLFDLVPKPFFESFYFLELDGDLSEEDFKLKAAFSDLITTFVKTGNPNEYLTKERDIVWAPYENTNKSYLSFSLQPSVHLDLYGDRRVIWEELVPQWTKEYEFLQTKQDLLNEDSKWGSSVDTFEVGDGRGGSCLFKGKHVCRQTFLRGRHHDCTEGPKHEHQTIDDSLRRHNFCEKGSTLLGNTVNGNHRRDIFVDTSVDSKPRGNDAYINHEGETYSSDEFEELELDTPNSLKDTGWDSNSNQEKYNEYARTNKADNVTPRKADDANQLSNQPGSTGMSTPNKAASEIAGRDLDGYRWNVPPDDEVKRSLGSSVDRIVFKPRPVLEKLDWDSSDTHNNTGKQHLPIKLCINQCNLMGKRVLIRVDYDVPIKGSVITDIQRIKATVPTIQLALNGGAKSVVLMSHLGHPGGRIEPLLTLKPVADVLAKQLKRHVTFLEDCVGPKIEAQCADPFLGSVILLENLRFHMEEEGHGVDESGRKVMATVAQIEHFRSSLTRLADIYVNDAFVTAHKSYSSVIGCAMKTRACGLLMKKELDGYSKLLDNPRKPFLAIVCGAKVSDKLLIIENLLDHVTDMFIGGGMAFTFLKILLNMEIGDSPFDTHGFQMVPKIIDHAVRCGVTLHLPVDFLVADRYAENASMNTCTRDAGIPKGMVGVAVGDQTSKLLTQVISRAKTIVWNGPPGVFEWEDFSHGTRAVMEAVVQVTEMGATTILVGGDTATCAMKFGAEDKVTHLSTGSGAGLEILEDKMLPGIFVLSGAPRQMCELDRLRIDQCCYRCSRVIIRADFDVPLRNGKIEDNSKILAALPSIEHVIEQDPRSLVLISHLGCPNGQSVAQHSLKPVAQELQRLLGRRVVFMNDCVGEEVVKACINSNHGSIFLLENLRFQTEEEGFCTGPDRTKIISTTEGVRDFRHSLSQLGNIFINDTFETAHRANSSTVGLDVGLKAAGFLMLKELNLFQKVVVKPERPYLAILGGSALAAKIVLMDNLIDLVDEMFIVGDLAFTFLNKLHGTSIGNSVYDEVGAPSVPVIVQKARMNGVQIHFPVDFVITDSLTEKAQTRTVSVAAGIPQGWVGMDIGETTRARFADVIGRAKTIVWNGCPGTFKSHGFSSGTEAMMKAVVEATHNGAISILQGRATIACCHKYAGADKVSRLCIEHGASAELLVGHSLPGVAALDPNPETLDEEQTERRTCSSSKKVEFCQCMKDKHACVYSKWVPPYTKKLPPLPTNMKPKERIKYTGVPLLLEHTCEILDVESSCDYGLSHLTLCSKIRSFQEVKAPLPGKSIPSPYGALRRQPSQPSARIPTDAVPRPKLLPPLSSTTKPRVPVQLQTLATRDNKDNLIVHINGGCKEIPEEAQVEVMLVQSYFPRVEPSKEGTNGLNQLKNKQRLGKRKLSPCMAQFKRRIQLASLQNSCNDFGTSHLPIDKVLSALEISDVQKQNDYYRTLFPMQ